MTSRWARLMLLAALAWGAAPPPSAVAADDEQGPPPAEPVSALEASVQCSPDVPGATRDPVLLVHGTAVDPGQFAWNWIPALKADGIPYCTVALLDHGMADIQASAEYVVYAIRTAHALSGRKVDVVGHSQGGMIPRWALRFWPDTRGMVDDMVGIAASNHGTVVADAFCGAGCAASIWQQRSNSAFLAALNAGAETWTGLDYTQVYTHLDEIVVPNLDDSGSTPLHTGGGVIANVAVQDVCPLATADHIAIGTSDAVAYAVARDALDNPGPAVAARVDGSVCTQAFMPAVDPLMFPVNYAAVWATIAGSLAAAPQLQAEPALRCYATNSCPAPASAAAPGAGATGPGPGAGQAAVRGATLAATGGHTGATTALAGVAAVMALAFRRVGMGESGRRSSRTRRRTR